MKNQKPGEPVPLNRDIDPLPILDAIFQKYGFDFRHYSEAHIKRRLLNNMIRARISDTQTMIDRINTNDAFTANLINDLSITVTEMFRDPDFYLALRKKVIPILRTYPFIKIWHAGCSTGEEAYSMAILLTEEGLYDRATIYATDFNQQALNLAKEGIYANELAKEYTINYQLAGGKESFSDYCTSRYDHVIMHKSLKKNILWANHNLVTDGVFSEVHLILCRNVMIYFNKSLQDKVQKLFYESLIKGGILGLGSKESLKFTEVYDRYSEIDRLQRIYKKKY